MTTTLEQLAQEYRAAVAARKASEGVQHEAWERKYTAYEHPAHGELREANRFLRDAVNAGGEMDGPALRYKQAAAAWKEVGYESLAEAWEESRYQWAVCDTRVRKTWEQLQEATKAS